MVFHAKYLDKANRLGFSGRMNLTKTQKAALLHFAKISPRTIQTNHQINAERALIKMGLIAQVWEGLHVKRWLTEDGIAAVKILTDGA